jgi:ribosome biogenesis GTPase
MTGLVIKGSRNLFTVRADGEELECRIKGKILKDAARQKINDRYNPIAPGDTVILERDPLAPGQAKILSVCGRNNLFVRFNQKEGKPQALAANVDLALCVTTPSSPPFRPRFLDRLLVQAEASGIPACIICNKYDRESDPDVEERLEDYTRIGYPALRVSARTGQGLDALRELAAGKRSVLLGQSGVGKTSLINALAPGLDLKTGEINEKYDRGNHTTSLSVLFEISTIFQGGSLPPNERLRLSSPPLRGGPQTNDDGGQENSETVSTAAPQRPAFLIDTPGIRRMVPWGVSASGLVLCLKEFAPLAGSCAYGLSCTHHTEEGCKIMEAVAAGVIHEDRYESFLRMTRELEEIRRA